MRDYTAGLNVREVRRLFDQEGPNTYAVLARDQEAPPGRHVRFAAPRRFLHAVKVVFFGISLKLSPARRLLFAGAILAALIALVTDSRFELDTRGLYLSLEADTLWLAASVAGLAFLLALELVDRIRVRDELEVARQLQSELLPSSAPRVDGYEFAHSYRTANEVGGDYYNFTELPDGRLALMVGDASGHGIAAGLLMAIANATLKTAIQIEPTPARVADLLNRTLVRTGDRRAFMTLFYAVLTPGTGELEFVCAGHPFPLLRKAGGRIEELGAGSLPLGMKEEIPVPAGRATIETGDLLVLFTDGLPEAVGGSHESAFGFARMRDLLAESGTAGRVHDRITTALDSHLGDRSLTDDYTLVVVARG